MNFRVFVVALAFVLAGCQSAAVASGQDQGSGKDGLTTKTAVKVPSIPAERAWIEQRYPGATLRGQALRMSPGPMDVISITLPSGENLDIYFDISPFFGKSF
ncbi:hypothetical protein ARC20_07955 [Stenotrophomonas panacihumi]|uniref:Uncharacterized protein n=1 Tax=Stenotrophomonas panacihumi TaxID=676599 RepID=A0A0R0AIE7_9GAMM|nr:hypothetical protein [Stenotrophomonas panacihumi]KRG44828.1 hypothetical protein ARC20_07955 [Stenotrophomonas panacihumi]PTN54147.1 hypothetical protein C9J98_11635 [Stenotrophomonas panacihumi]